MKVGTENKKATTTAVVLLIAAAVLFYRGFQAPSANAPATKAGSGVQAVSSTAKARSRNGHGYVGTLLQPTLDPHLRVDLLAESEGTSYEGSGHDIFADDEEEIPKPVAPGLIASSKPVDAPPAWQPPPPPPPPPPINLKFWGWANLPGESKSVFLAQGENGFVAHEGDILARRYKVEKIGPSSVEIEDLLSNNRQTIPVTY